MREIVIENINGKEEIVYKDEKELQVINPNKTSLERRKELNQRLNEEFYRSKNKKRLLETASKKYNYKKLIVFETVVALALAGTLVGAKVYKDHKEYQMKKTQILNEDKTFTSVEIKSGDTIESIARKYYNELPDDKKQYITFQEYKYEIIAMNNLSDPNQIKAGNNLIVPYYLEEEFILKKN